MELTKRQKGARARAIVHEITGVKPVGSRYDTGTASGWITIRMPRSQPVSRELEQKAEAQIAAERLCATYLPDDGLSVARELCLSWEFAD
ncbi:hypothetical protein CcrMagneto_gp219 [Caulobacter virus Magneto]|uniref:hypothetical protein n=1 Tax=Caulobacter virus Magneto TaxID=1211642 RepID=UPI00028B3746|nr:hypothetical protein CcrMagneto_gp219 [Caulobacter virus Magneto]AFU87389.1 hypothetical protein CcrMagneto_gp219 [Caulobacter virus Magneto]